ncbi:MAG TPA: hypothetical protein VLR52_06455, partial [Bacteroidales bacterium]|nr:hypothetical protein [Bacteroidales bacterium]
MKNRSVILLALTLILLISGCTRKKEMVSTQRFAKQTWNRFDILKFDIPVAREGSYDVLLEASHTTGFEGDIFSVNMIMVTPSGEERIN